MSDAPLADHATQALASGDLLAAEQHARASLCDDPSNASALHVLGLISQRRGDHLTAIGYFNHSLLVDGTNAVTWQHLGDSHLAVGRFRDAAANFEQAVRLKPDFGEAYNNLGVVWQYLGQWKKAEDCLREALALMPPRGLLYDNLGIALKKQGKLDEAESAFKEALRLSPDHPEYTYNLGVNYHEKAELDQAEECYREALRLLPENANASNNLATILKEQGRVEEATKQYQHTLDIQPEHPFAFYNLAEIASEGKYEFSRAELDRFKAFMASERCGPTERSLCCFGLAMVLQREGHYDEAFHNFSEGNRLRKEINERNNVAFDPIKHDAFVDRIIALHDKPRFERVRGWGHPSEAPIFIVGMPRSGSTLVEQILASHPRVFGAGEINEMPRLVNQLAQRMGGAVYDKPLIPDAPAAIEAATEFLDRATKHAPDCTRFTLKTLENYLHLGVIATLFPRARVIHCRRHPLDACLSCFFQNFNNVIFAWSLEDIGACYRSYEKLMAHWAQVLPLPCLELQYEDLVRDQEGHTRRLLEFCGLDWDERCLSFFKTRRVVRTASSLQVRKPISTDTIGRWKPYRAHLGPLFQALGRYADPLPSDAAWKRPEHSARP